MDQLLEVNIFDLPQGWREYSPIPIFFSQTHQEDLVTPCFWNQMASPDFWFTTRVKSILSYHQKIPITSFNVPKNKQLVYVAHVKVKNKKIWVFMHWTALQTIVSSPCAFEALTCVLFMQCFNFFTRMATCNYNLLAPWVSVK